MEGLGKKILEVLNCGNLHGLTSRHHHIPLKMLYK